jgi:hypothetical protein
MMARLELNEAFAAAVSAAGPTGNVGGLMAGSSRAGIGGSKPASDGMRGSEGSNESIFAEQKQVIGVEAGRATS